MRDFDAFVFNPALSRMKSRSSWLLTILFGVILVLVVVGANLIQGSFGTLEDFRLFEDFRAVLPTDNSSGGKANFPFIRDFASWVLLASIIVGFYLLHRQGKLMSQCLSRLAANGAIVARDEIPVASHNAATIDRRKTFGLNWFSGLIRLNRVVESSGVDDAFDNVIDRANSFCADKPRTVFVGTCVIAAPVIGALLLIGPTREFFLALAPQTVSAVTDSGEWLDKAYGTWWASIEHPIGFVVYLMCAIIAFLIILSFQPVGLSVLYLIIAMRYLTDWSADWSNQDGCYGWRPVAEVYRTVLQAVSLLGLAVSVMLLMLGIRNYTFVLIPVILYICVAPLFVIVPRIVWRDVAERAKRNRIASLLSGIDTDNPNEHAVALLQEAERCRNAEIKPLRVRKLWTSTGFTALIFPVVLTVLQLAFPWFVHAPN